MTPKIPKFLLRNLNAAYYHMCRLGTPLPAEAERMLRDGLHRWAEAAALLDSHVAYMTELGLID